MKNEPKTDVLLHMMEQPERYTEEQWRDILRDSECRELYTLMAMTHGSVAAAKADAELTEEEIEREWEKVKDPPLTLPCREGVECVEGCILSSSKVTTPSLQGRVRGGSSSLHRIAAIFLAAAFLGGLTWAISPLIRQKEKAPRSAGVSTLPLEGERGGGLEREGGLLLFADVRLDSMLTVVAAHYGKAVFFSDEELKALRIHTKWNQEDSLASFIENLNELDELSLTEQRDTIFVQGKTLPSPSL
ncbi:MAG: DUF4974 domain-containing protein [Bacteroidaceae bacterium]|nr:DUF4974 domain-containing protein [Bacteroidaceae bacterium]